MNLTFEPVINEQEVTNNLIFWARKLFGSYRSDKELLELIQNYIERALEEEETI